MGIKYDGKEISLQDAIDIREGLIKAAREVNDKAIAENRALSAEEKSKYDKSAADIRSLLDSINAEKRAQELDGFSHAAPAMNPGGSSGDSAELEEFRRYLRTGETRDLHIDPAGSPTPSTNAGALAPKGMLNEIITAVRQPNTLTAKVRSISLAKVQAVDIPVELTEMAAPSFKAETEQVSADTAQNFGAVTLGADRLPILVKISRKTVLSSAVDIVQFIKDEMAFKLRAGIENAILNGDGSGEPQGIFDTTGTNKLSTGRDVTGTANDHKITADEIIKLKRKVAAPYRANGVYVMHPDTVTDCLLLKDSNNQYIWRSGLLPSDPDTLNGSPVVESDYCPGTPGAGKYLACFGDFSKYYLTMLEQLSIQVLLEKYADYGQYGYLAEVFAGGAPVAPQAFARWIGKAAT